MEIMTVDKDKEQASNICNINYKLNKNDYKFNFHDNCKTKGSKVQKNEM